MSSWDVGPFDNDSAGDFGYELDDASPQQRIDLVGRALARVMEDDPLFFGAERAVASAALVAAQYPGGVPVTSIAAMPPFPAYLRELAIAALDRVVTPPSHLVETWAERFEGPAWRRAISELRTVLDPPQRESLFDLADPSRVGPP